MDIYIVVSGQSYIHKIEGVYAKLSKAMFRAEKLAEAEGLFHSSLLSWTKTSGDFVQIIKRRVVR